MTSHQKNAVIEIVDGEILGCTICSSELRARERAAAMACENATITFAEAMTELRTIGRIEDAEWSVSVVAARNEGESE